MIAIEAKTAQVKLTNPHDKPARVLEFFGLSGAGKTTLQRLVLEILAKQHDRVHGREDIRSWLRETPRYQKATLSARNAHLSAPRMLSFARYTVSMRPRKPMRLSMALRLTQYPLYVREFARRRKTEVLVLDEWGVQWLWAIGIGRTIPGETALTPALAAYMRACPPTTYVYVAVSAEEAASRIASRVGEDTIFDRLSTEMALPLLKQSERGMVMLANAIEKSGQRVLRIEAADDPILNAAKIAALH